MDDLALMCTDGDDGRGDGGGSGNGDGGGDGIYCLRRIRGEVLGVATPPFIYGNAPSSAKQPLPLPRFLYRA